jgi:hypothetical protein
MPKSSLRNLYNDPGLLETTVSQWLTRWAYHVGGSGTVYVYHPTNVGYIKQKLREIGYPDIQVKSTHQSRNS